MARRRTFGAVRKLPSGRWQAHYRLAGTKHPAPATFETRIDAEGWLRRVERGDHTAPAAEPSRAVQRSPSMPSRGSLTAT